MYVFVAMLLTDEIDECAELAVKYWVHPLAVENRLNAVELFGSSDAAGYVEVRRQIDGLPHDYETFWEGLSAALKIVS